MKLLQRAEKKQGSWQNPVPTTLGGLKLMAKLLPLYLSNKAEVEPKEPVGPFQTDPAAWTEPPTSGLRVTWFGHSSTLLAVDGVRLLLDPVWDRRASPSRWFGPKRFFAPTVELKNLPRLDAVLVSHDHYDHLCKGTVAELARVFPEARWITSNGVGDILRRFGANQERITEMNWLDRATVQSKDGAEVEIAALPARHFSGRALWNRFGTLWSSFAIRGSRHHVYFGADSGYWDGFGEIGREFGPFDLSLLEIGAFHPLWKEIHLGPDAAVRAFQDLGGAGLLMPIHWGLFNLALHAWREPMERMTELAAMHRVPLFSPEPGRPEEVVPGRALLSTWWQGVG